MEDVRTGIKVALPSLLPILPGSNIEAPAHKDRMQGKIAESGIGTNDMFGTAGRESGGQDLTESQTEWRRCGRDATRGA